MVSFLGDAESSLSDAKSSLGDAKSSLSDAESSLGDAKSSLGDAKSSLGDIRLQAGSTGKVKMSLLRCVSLPSRPTFLRPEPLALGVAEDEELAAAREPPLKVERRRRREAARCSLVRRAGTHSTHTHHFTHVDESTWSTQAAPTQ